MKKTGGYLGTSIRYLSALYYNTFPSIDITQNKKNKSTYTFFEILEEKEKHSGKTLTRLYDSNRMPKSLKKVHHQLDLAI